MKTKAPSVVKPDLIHLEGIRILKAHFEISAERTEERVHVDKFDIGLKSESGFNLDKKYLQFRLYVKIKGTNEQGENLGVDGEYVFEFAYFIENLMEFVTFHDDKKNFKVEAILGATIAGISYSTSRGVILERTQATDFGGVLLPVVNPNILLGQDSYSDMV